MYCGGMPAISGKMYDDCWYRKDNGDGCDSGKNFQSGRNGTLRCLDVDCEQTAGPKHRCVLVMEQSTGTAVKVKGEGLNARKQ